MLTPLQRRVAAVFAAIPLRNAFVLAGGAALDVYGITNRRTEDLDFFSCESERVAEAAEALTVALRRDGLTVDVEQRGRTFIRVFVSDETEDLHVDLAYDAVTLPSEATSLGPALARDELAGSKLLALFGRGEPRDFLDVRNLLEHYSTDELVALAERFDAGFDRRVLAEMLGRVTRLPRNAFAASDDEYDEAVRLFTMWQRNLNEAEDG